MTDAARPPGARCAASPTPSRPTTRRRTSRASSSEALDSLSLIAETFEIIAVDDGSRDPTRVARRRRFLRGILGSAAPATTRSTSATGPRRAPASAPPGTSWSRSRTAPPTSSRDVIVPRHQRLAEQADRPDVVVGFRIRRADPIVRAVYARAGPAGEPGTPSSRPQGQGRRLRCASPSGAQVLNGVQVESEGAFFQAGAADQASRHRAQRRRGGGAPLPTHGWLADGCEPEAVASAVRDFCACDCRVREPAGGARRGRPTARQVGPRAVLALRLSPRVHLERVDEVAEHVEPRVDDPFPGRVEDRPPTVPSPHLAAARCCRRGRPARRPRAPRRSEPRPGPASASASHGRASISPMRPSRSTMTAARGTSPSARSAITTRATRAAELLERASRTGRGSAGAPASGPGGASRSRRSPRPDPDRQVALAPVSLRMTTWLAGEHGTRTLSTTISTNPVVHVVLLPWLGRTPTATGQPHAEQRIPAPKTKRPNMK